MNVVNIDIKNGQMSLLADSFVFPSGAELERRIMKNMRLEKWTPEEGEPWQNYGIDTPAKYIAMALIERDYDSLDKYSEVQSYLLRLVGWGDHKRKLGQAAPFDQERQDPNSAFREECLCVQRITTAWRRLLRKEV